MARRQEARGGPAEAWTQTVQGFSNAAAELVGQTMHWQQDLVRLWVDTQQQVAGFWIRTQEEATRAGERTRETSGGARRRQH